MAEESKQLTLDEVKAIIGAEGFDRDGLATLLKSDYNVELPDNLEGEALAGFVFETYQTKAQEVAQESSDTKDEKKKDRRAARRQKSKEPLVDLDGNAIEVPEIPRTQYMEEAIKNAAAAGINQKDLMAKVDEAYGYSKRGKSPRTRVTKTVRGLIEGNKVTKKESGELVWIAT